LQRDPAGRVQIDNLPSIGAIQQGHSHDPVYGRTGSATDQAREDHWDDTHRIGRLLFTTYVAPFEVTSLLILVATVGVIVLCKQDDPPRPAPHEEIIREAPPLREPAPETAGTR
jgi:hypothetical protein